ncbi:MAG: tetratricopeptide repeat protein [Planctomycetota bacterium]
MKRIASILLAGAALVWAGAAAAAQAKVEDETLPRPLKGQPAEYYSALANVHAAFGHFETAEKLQLKALAAETNPAKKEKISFELVDRIYLRARWWDKAAAELLRTISLVNKQDAAQLRKYHMDRALVLAEAGNSDEQIKELEIIVKLSKDEGDRKQALHKLHTIMKRFKKLQRKAGEYEAIVRKNPQDKETLRILAEIYEDGSLLKLPGKAILKYEQIRKLDPDDIDACERLARLYVEAKQREKSLAMYERLMKLNPKRFDLYFADAVSQMSREREEEQAIEWAKKMFEKYPDKPAVPLRIANFHVGRREYAAAAEYHKKAIALMGGPADKLPVYFRLIESQIAAEQYAEAEQTCIEAQKLRILSPTLRKKLRDLLMKARDLQGKTGGP